MFSAIHPMQLVFGFIIWSAWFVVMYGLLSVGCSVATPGDSAGSFTWINGVLLLITVLTTSALSFFTWRCWRVQAPEGNRQFVARIAAGVYGVAAISTLAIGLPVFVLPPCV